VSDGVAPAGINSRRRNFLIGATSAVGAVGTAGLAIPYLGSWTPSAKARAAGAPIKIDVSKLESGQILGPIPAWRDKPVFVIRRSEEMLAKLNQDDSRLADPSSERPMQPVYAQNQNRSIKPEYLVLIGLCTHLNCSPKFYPLLQPETFDPNWVGGFYCPCHGSKFDMAGRVYAGVPAPSNMEVPPHFYESEGVLVIGEEGGAA